MAYKLLYNSIGIPLTLLKLRGKMTESRLFGHTSQVIGKALNVSARRHNLIAGNIANMDTIGYKPTDLDFNQTLKRAMDEKEPDYLDKTHSKHLSPDDGEPFSMNGK